MAGSGAWASLVGPLGPRSSALVLGSACGCGAVIGAATARRSGLWRGALVGLVAADLVGGLVSFQLGPTRAHYAQTSSRARLTFVVAHLQPFVLPLIGQGTWTRATVRWATAVVATVALDAYPGSPSSRRFRAVAVGAVAGVTDVVTAPSGQRWFGPVYLMKLIGGHGGVPTGPEVRRVVGRRGRG